MRGKDVSRIEGFSDAVFGFTLTLLVVSLEVPNTVAELRVALAGFPAFAAMFALVCWIWYEHYAFFRRFALHDDTTIFLNSVLLFVVMFFAYPLKFTFTRVVGAMIGLGPRFDDGAMSYDDGRLLMLVFSFGFIAVFAIFGLLHGNALRRRDELQLTTLELFDARSAMQGNLLSVAVGVTSVVLTLLLPRNLVGLSGMFYFVLGPVHAYHGWRTGRARKAFEVAS